MQGPKGANRAEFVEDIKDTLGQIYLASTPEYTIGGLFAPPDKFNAALRLMAKTLADPAMGSARLEDLRKAQLAAVAQAARQPGLIANRIGAHFLWEEGPMLGWTKEDPANFTTTSLAQIEDWRRSVLTRKGLVIAAAGPASPEQAAAQIDELFAGLPLAGPELSAPVFTRRSVSGAVLIEADVPQTMILIGGWSAFERGTEQSMAVLAARALQARLHRELREKLGATYGATAQTVSLISQPVVFSMNSMVAHERAIEALDVMRKEHQKFLADGLSQNELDSERQRLSTEFQENIRRPPAVATLLRGALFDGQPADYVETFPQRLAAFTLVDINAILKKGLAGKAVGTVVVAPKGREFSGFCAIGEIEQVNGCKLSR
jgi:zinc protease